jgi:thioredoxin reductase (NADPH)
MVDHLMYVAAGFLTVGIPLVYVLRESSRSRRAAQTLQKAVERGLDEPVSLHPLIDPTKCIGSGACVSACPEHGVLGLIDNRGALTSPARCIGHGLCASACPVEAITLVFGTSKRGVDIPHVQSTFETNVPGLFIAGELGGMGLIRNAVTQGKQAVKFITQSLACGGDHNDMLDLVVVGAGPAGISASLQAKQEGLEFLVVDQQDLGGTVLTYPRRKLVMTQPWELPLYGIIKQREMQKETLLEIFGDVFAKTGLSVNSEEKTDDVQRVDDHFQVTTARGVYNTRRVLLAIGRRGTPRKLDVPGERSGKVSYRLLDPEHFTQMKVLVVGGGDSAVEAAVALSEQPGNIVHVSYRRDGFFRLKEGNQTRVEAAIAAGKVIPVFNSTVKAIEPDAVTLEQEGRETSLPNDYVFVFAGGELPTAFLQKMGVEITRKFGQR